MVEPRKRRAKEMAGEFTSLFRSLDHPVEALKGLGEKAAGEAAAGHGAAHADALRRRHGGGRRPAGQGLMDSLMGRIAGIPARLARLQAMRTVNFKNSRR